MRGDRAPAPRPGKEEGKEKAARRRPCRPHHKLTQAGVCVCVCVCVCVWESDDGGVCVQTENVCDPGHSHPPKANTVPIIYIYIQIIMPLRQVPFEDVVRPPL